MGYEKIKSMLLLEDAVAAPTISDVVRPGSKNKTFQAIGSTTSGAGSATVLIQGSLNNENWETIDTLTCTIASEAAPGTDFGSDLNPWPYVRANVSAITGTGASVDVYLACDNF